MSRKEIPMDTPLDIVNRFYQAFYDRRIKDMRALLSEHVTLVTPSLKLTGSAAYVAAAERFLQVPCGIKMVRQFRDEDEVCSIYEQTLTPPAGNSVTVPVADWIEVKDGHIAAQRVYFDR